MISLILILVCVACIFLVIGYAWGHYNGGKEKYAEGYRDAFFDSITNNIKSKYINIK